MVGGAKTLMMLAVALMPGGLLVLMAWVLTRAVRLRMQETTGAQGARLARAVAAVRWRDIWSKARHAVDTPTPSR